MCQRWDGAYLTETQRERSNVVQCLCSAIVIQLGTGWYTEHKENDVLIHKVERVAFPRALAVKYVLSSVNREMHSTRRWCVAFSGTYARGMVVVEQYRSAVLNMPDAVFARSSGGQVERKARSSFIMVRMFAAVTKARESSKARLETRKWKITFAHT